MSRPSRLPESCRRQGQGDHPDRAAREFLGGLGRLPDAPDQFGVVGRSPGVAPGPRRRDVPPEGALGPERPCPWWHEVNTYAFQSAFVDADRAWKNWLDSLRGARAGRKIGYPRFKKKGRARDAFRLHHSPLTWAHRLVKVTVSPSRAACSSTSRTPSARPAASGCEAAGGTRGGRPGRGSRGGTRHGRRQRGSGLPCRSGHTDVDVAPPAPRTHLPAHRPG